MKILYSQTMMSAHDRFRTKDEEDKYKEYLRRNMAHQLADGLLEEGLIAFTESGTDPWERYEGRPHVLRASLRVLEFDDTEPEILLDRINSLQGQLRDATARLQRIADVALGDDSPNDAIDQLINTLQGLKR